MLPQNSRLIRAKAAAETAAKLAEDLLAEYETMSIVDHCTVILDYIHLHPECVVKTIGA